MSTLNFNIRCKTTHCTDLDIQSPITPVRKESNDSSSWYLQCPLLSWSATAVVSVKRTFHALFFHLFSKIKRLIRFMSGRCMTWCGSAGSKIMRGESPLSAWSRIWPTCSESSNHITTFNPSTVWGSVSEVVCRLGTRCRWKNCAGSVSASAASFYRETVLTPSNPPSHLDINFPQPWHKDL